MACAQANGSAEAYYEKNKTLVNETKNKAQALVTKHCSNGADKFQVATTAGVIKNISNGILSFKTSHDYAGHFVVPCDNTIVNTGEFVHAANPGFGNPDSAAVIYTDGCSSGTGLLLAWSVPGSVDCDNKVYVEIGPIHELTKWGEVKAKLEASGSKSYYETKKGIHFSAEINPTGSSAHIAAHYVVAC